MTDERLPPNKVQLRRELRALAREFADRVVDVLEEHGMFEERPNDWSVQTPRVRRTPDALSALCERLLEVLETTDDAVAISRLAQDVGMSTREIAHPLSLLIDKGLVVRSGLRRGARYRLAHKQVGRKVRARPSRGGQG